MSLAGSFEMSLTPASGNGKGLLSVPKLLDDGSNWVLYREKITSIIEGQTGYRKHFRGRAQPPKALSGADAKDDDKVEKYEDSLDEYIQKQQAIRAIILPSIPESLQLRVISEEPVSAMWSAVLWRGGRSAKDHRLANQVKQ